MHIAKKNDLQNTHKERISHAIRPSVSTTLALIDVLNGEIPPQTDETTTENINHPIKAIVHTNFLPPLKGTTLELCKLGHRMEHVYGKQLF